MKYCKYTVAVFVRYTFTLKKIYLLLKIIFKSSTHYILTALHCKMNAKEVLISVTREPSAALVIEDWPNVLQHLKQIPSFSPNVCYWETLTANIRIDNIHFTNKVALSGIHIITQHQILLDITADICILLLSSDRFHLKYSRNGVNPRHKAPRPGVS